MEMSDKYAEVYERTLASRDQMLHAYRLFTDEYDERWAEKRTTKLEWHVHVITTELVSVVFQGLHLASLSMLDQDWKDAYMYLVTTQGAIGTFMRAIASLEGLKMVERQ